MKNVDDNNTSLPEAVDRSVLSLIRGIQNGSVEAGAIGIKERRLCVSHLTSEGYSVAEIAEILKASDRTITRDRATIRETNAINASPELTSQMVGSLLFEADTSIAKIRRATRSGDIAPATKIEGEKACWVITRDLVHCLQRLGFLPTAPQQFLGQLSHHIEGVGAPGYEDLHAELSRLELIYAPPESVQPDSEAVSPSSGAGVGSGGALDQIMQVKDIVTRLALGHQVQQIELNLEASSIEGEGGENEAR